MLFRGLHRGSGVLVILNDEIVVYYTNFANVFVDDPQPLFQSLIDEFKNKNSLDSKSFKKCPAFRNYCNNIFVLSNALTYDLTWSDSGYKSSKINQEFFSKWVKLRSDVDGLVSYTYPEYVFVANEPVLMDMTSPYLHDCDLAKKVTYLPGSYDVGLHARPLEIAMYIRNKNDTVVFKQDDPFMYIKFHTNKKIKFKKFMYTNELKELMAAPLGLRNNQEIKPLDFWYKIFKSNYRKTVLKIIRKNLM